MPTDAHDVRSDIEDFGLVDGLKMNREWVLRALGMEQVDLSAGTVAGGVPVWVEPPTDQEGAET